MSRNDADTAPAPARFTMPDARAIAGDIKGGLVASTACVAFTVANGAFIYSATLEPMLRVGIVASLVTTAVTTVVMALASTFKPVVSTASSATAAPLGAIMLSTAPALALLPQHVAVATVFALVAVATLVTGIVLILLGSARLGKVVRFIPFPVVAGFMGVTGTLLTLGAIRFGTGVPVAWAQLHRFLAPDTAGLLVLTIGFAAIVTLTTRRFKHPLVLPGLLLAAILAVDALARATGYTIDAPQLRGLFLVPKNTVPIDLPLLLHLPFDAQWRLIPPLFGSIAAYVVLVVLATLLTSSGLEAALNVDANYNRELQAQGLACVASSLCGGFVGNPSVGATMAGVTTGARGRFAGITNGIVMIVVAFVGLPLLPYVPRFVIGGLLAHIGFWIIATWCVASRSRMPRGEWLVVIGIVAVTIWSGLVPAILAGLLAGCILFALDVSRVGVVRREYGLDRRASLVVRPSEEIAILSREGHRVRFLELGGMLFFGSAYQILTRVQHLVEVEQPDIIVLDLTAVTGCDSSTTAVISRMRKLLARETIGFAVAGGGERVLDLLRSSGCLAPADPTYANLDHALEAGEIAVLGKAADAARPAESFHAWLREALGDDALAGALVAVCGCADHLPGEYLCRQGDPTDTLLFIESGRVDVVVGPPEAERCVRVFGPQTIAGEHGFVLGLPRTASLKVARAARVRVLDRASFAKLQDEQPALVIALLRDIVRLQSERLVFATRQNAALA